MSVFNDKIDIVKYDDNGVPIGQLHVSYQVLDFLEESSCLDGEVQRVFIPPSTANMKVLK